MPFRVKKILIKLLLFTRGIDFFWRRRPKGLYVFNYHRIGDAQDTEFDRAVFSCTEKAFEKHVILLKNNFTVINCQQLITLINNQELTQDRYAIITFDDGYVDNYIKAFPILKKHNISGSFYIATDFVGSTHIPWWDEIAYLLRNSCGQSYSLPNKEEKFFLEERTIDRTIREIMTGAKTQEEYSVLDVLADVRKMFPLALSLLQKENSQLFMSWPQIKDMAENGMEIGSHTLSHRILSRLSKEDQNNEIFISKEILENKLNRTINTIAYPVGRYNCYNELSYELVEKAKYDLAFNNEPGFHQHIENIYNINRFCVVKDEIDYLKFECCFNL